jgi:hypothetical protein
MGLGFSGACVVGINMYLLSNTLGRAFTDDSQVLQVTIFTVHMCHGANVSEPNLGCLVFSDFDQMCPLGCCVCLFACLSVYLSVCLVTVIPCSLQWCITKGGG